MKVWLEKFPSQWMANCILFYGKDLYTWREFQIFKTTKQMDYIHIHELFYY